MSNTMSGHRNNLPELESDLALNQRLLDFLSGGMNGALEVASDIAQYCEDDDALKKATKDTMLTFINMEKEIKQYIAALKHVKSMPPGGASQGQRSGQGDDLMTQFKDKLGQLQASGAKDRLEEHAKYQELVEVLDNTGSIEEQLANLRTALLPPTEDSQGDLAMTETEVNTRCPYTGRTMADPVRNKLCGHVYDREGILTYITQKRAKAKCPVGGCGNKEPIQVSHLEDHRDLRRYITLLSQSQSQAL